MKGINYMYSVTCSVVSWAGCMLKTCHRSPVMRAPTVGIAPSNVLLDLLLTPVPKLGCASIFAIFLEQRGACQVGPERKHASKRSNCGSNKVS